MTSSRLAALLARFKQCDELDTSALDAISEILDAAENRQGAEYASSVTNVVFFDAKPYDKQSFESFEADEFSFRYIQSPLSKETAGLAKGCSVVCIFVNDCCDEDVVKQLVQLGVKCIALRCAGFNNVDLTACKSYNMQVVRVPAYSPHAVAEHAVALMLMLNRQLHRAYLRNRSGQFVLDGLVGFDMFNKKIGVIGTGKIGQCVIDILLGFGCNILAYDTFPSASLQLHERVHYLPMEALLSQADIVTLHAPLTKESQHLINDASISKMKKGAMIINTSRGGLIDSKALIRGLKTQHIGAAGLDVYEEEEGIFFNDISNQVLDDDVLARLMSFNNVVITSHQAFLTQEALSNIAETTLFNLRQYAKGKLNGDLLNSIVSG